MVMDNKTYQRGYCRKYYQKYLMTIGPGVQVGAIGKAAELLVEADLLLRGGLVTRPSNPCAHHDLHVKFGRSWYTLQIKAAKKNIKTGVIGLNTEQNQRVKKSRSDVLAIVTVSGVTYKALRIRKLPRKLR